MTRIHANNFETTLNGSISNSATTATLTSVTGLPAIGAGVTCNITFEDGGLNEIVTATAVSGFVVTITRAQEGTTAKAFGTGANASIRATRDSIDGKQDLLSGSSQTSVTVATDDKVLIQDTSDSNNLKTVTAQSIADLAASSSGSVPSGGTGLSVSTPYAVLCGGTTSTSALQYIVSLGTAGQVLTSNGSGALPSMQNPSAGTGSLLGITDIKDSNNNKSINITATTSSVNYIDVINAASGTNPKISAAGAGTNLTLLLQGKGTGWVSIVGTTPKLSIDNITIWEGGSNEITNTGCGASVFLNATGSATQNSAFGNSTLIALTNGNRNSAIGYRALYTGTSVSDSTAIGSSCLTTATGNNNTAIGSACLLSVSTGSNNTALGMQSGTNSATGSASLTTGTDNTLLGYRSGVDTLSTIGAIAIGSNAVSAKATGTTSSDNGPGIAIGSTAFPVGFRGDGTIYSAVGSSAGYWRVKINGTVYKIQLFADV